MSTARKVLDLHGQDTTELAAELAALPQGRYVLVPENEPDARYEPDEVERSPEFIQSLWDGHEYFERGGEGVTLDEYFAERARRRAARTP